MTGDLTTVQSPNHWLAVHGVILSTSQKDNDWQTNPRVVEDVMTAHAHAHVNDWQGP
jgi:hypothetical protein